MRSNRNVAEPSVAPELVVVEVAASALGPVVVEVTADTEPMDAAPEPHADEADIALAHFVAEPAAAADDTDDEWIQSLTEAEIEVQLAPRASWRYPARAHPQDRGGTHPRSWVCWLHPGPHVPDLLGTAGLGTRSTPYFSGLVSACKG